MIEDARFFVSAAQVLAVDFRVNVPIYENQVRPAIVIEIEKHGSPTQILRVQAQASRRCGIGEGAVAVVAIQGGSVVRKICLKDVEVAVAVVIGDSRSHAGLFAAIVIESCSCCHRNVSKCPVMIVAIKNAWRAVAGDEYVGPAILVEIERGDTERVMTVGTVDVGFGGDVFEGALALVVIQDIFRARQTARAAHHRDGFPDAGGALARSGRGREIKVHIIGHDQIKFAVAIIVNESATCAPGLPRAGHSSLLCDLGEDAALVVIQAILAVVSYIQIFPAVIVVVSNADALSPASCREARLRGDIGESPIVIVAIEMVAGSLPSRKFRELGFVQLRSIHQENVGPAIVVVVEDGDAGAGGLDDVFLGLDTAKDFLHGEAGLFADIGEIRDWLLGRGCPGLLALTCREASRESRHRGILTEANTQTAGNFPSHDSPCDFRSAVGIGHASAKGPICAILRRQSLTSIPMRATRFSVSLLFLAILGGRCMALPQTKPTGSASSTAYQSGLTAMQRGDLPAARAAFEKAVTLNPQSADAQNMLGQVLLQQGDFDHATEHFRTLIKLRPRLAIAHAYLAQSLQAKSLLDDAVAEYRVAVKLAPSEPKAHQALGRALSLQQKTDEAIAELQQAVTLAPQEQGFHDELGALLAQESKFADAEKEFREALKLNSDYEPALLHLGVTFSSEGKRRDALETFDRAIKLDPKDAMAWYYRGRTLEADSDPQEALHSYEHAVELKPESVLLQTSFGILLQRRGDPDRAVAAFTKVVKLTPSDSEAHNNLGLALLQVGQADAAITQFQAAIQLQPNDSGFQGNLGTAFLQKTDFDAAETQFRAALKLDPEKASLHHDLALALKLKDNLPGAIAEWKEAIRLDPQLADAFYSLGVTLWQSGDFPAAADHLKRAIEIEPNYAEAYYTLGTVLKQMGKLPDSADALRQALRLEPDFAGAHVTLAAVLRQLGDAVGAAAESKAGAEVAKEKTNLQTATFATNSGRRLLNAGDVDGAISQFQAAIQAMPRNAMAHYQLGIAFLQKGQKEEAGKEFGKAAELDPQLTPPAP